MPIKALVLDLGNVVIDLDFRKMLNALGLPPAASEKQAMEGLDRIPHFDAFERGHLDEAGFLNVFLPSLPRPLSFIEFERAWNTIFLGEVPGIDATLAAIAPKIPLYALTNVNPIHMRRLDQFPAMRHFRHIFTSFELESRKPEPEIYRRVCRTLGHDPSELLFLDDREENVVGARDVGLNAAQVARSPAAVVQHLSQYGVVL